MSCLTGNCSGVTCRPDVISPHMPPRNGGWTLRGYPDFVPENFRSRYGSNPVWQGNTHTDVIGAFTSVMKANGVPVDKAALCLWANEQWCQADPSRCNNARSREVRLAARRNESLIASKMQWAKSFWRVWNVAMSDHGRPEESAFYIVGVFIEAARHLISGNAGCANCKKHFEELLVEYPPERITNYQQARVWLWRVHNASRENLTPTAYYDIAKIYGWDLLSDEDLSEVIEGLRV